MKLKFSDDELNDVISADEIVLTADELDEKAVKVEDGVVRVVVVWDGVNCKFVVEDL